MQETIIFAGRSVRPASIGIVGFGTIAQIHCRYLLSEMDGDSSILMIFPGIHDSLGDSWPPPIHDPLFECAMSNAGLLFVEESVSSIVPMPGQKGGGYVIETSQQSYRFGNVYLEPVSMDAA